MLVRGPKAFVIYSLTVLSLALLGTGYPDADQPARPLNLAGLEVKVELPEADLAFLQPVYVMVSFHNASKAALLIPDPHPCVGLWLKITETAHKRELLATPSETSTAAQAATALAIPAGQTRTLCIDLCSSLELWMFSGELKLEIVYGKSFDQPYAQRVGDVEVPLRWELSLRIHKWTQREKQVINYFGGFRANDVHKSLAAIVPLYATDTVYYKYSPYWIGYYVEEGDPALALEQYEKLVKDFPTFPLIQQVKYKILALRNRLGKVKDFQADLRALLDETTDIDVRQMIENDLAKKTQMKADSSVMPTVPKASPSSVVVPAAKP